MITLPMHSTLTLDDLLANCLDATEPTLSITPHQLWSWFTDYFHDDQIPTYYAVKQDGSLSCPVRMDVSTVQSCDEYGFQFTVSETMAVCAKRLSELNGQRPLTTPAVFMKQLIPELVVSNNVLVYYPKDTKYAILFHFVKHELCPSHVVYPYVLRHGDNGRLSLSEFMDKLPDKIKEYCHGT